MSTFLVNFVLQDHWKERVKFSKVINLESDFVGNQLTTDSLEKSRKFTDVSIVRGTFAPPLRQLETYHLKTWEFYSVSNFKKVPFTERSMEIRLLVPINLKVQTRTPVRQAVFLHHLHFPQPRDRPSKPKTSFGDSY